jgi:hypothetical protein
MKLIAIIAIALTSLCAIGAAQAPDPLPAEALKVLKLFVGTCDTTIDGNPGLKGAATGVLVLGDRFVRDDFVLKDGDGSVVLQVSSMITYDTNAKRYRMWMFSSTGEVTPSEGTWDEATRTLTMNSRDAKGHATKWTSSFSAEGVETWSLVTKDQDGNVVLEVKGKSTARSKA